MVSAIDLHALARRRLAVIASARAVAVGKFDRPVSQSHALRNATVRLPRHPENRTVAQVSHDAAIAATSDGRTSCTVSFPIECDNATPEVAFPAVTEPIRPERLGRQGAPSKRAPAWAGSADHPVHGSICSCCGLGQWWCERSNPKGWRCGTCHPPDHLSGEAVTEVLT